MSDPSPAARRSAARSRRVLSPRWRLYDQEVPAGILDEAEALLGDGDFDVLLDERLSARWPAEVARFRHALLDRLGQPDDSGEEKWAIEVRVNVLTAAWFAVPNPPALLLAYLDALTSLERRWRLRHRREISGDEWLMSDGAVPSIAMTSHRGQVLVMLYGRQSPSTWSVLDAKGALVPLDEAAFAQLAVPPQLVTDVATTCTRWRDLLQAREQQRYQLEQESAHIGFPYLPERLRPRLADVTIGDLFTPDPVQYGMNGDTLLWMQLQRTLASIPLPPGSFELRTILERAFEEAVGTPLDSAVDSVYVPDFDPGSGISRGMVKPSWWRDTGIPILLDRHQRHAVEHDPPNG